MNKGLLKITGDMESEFSRYARTKGFLDKAVDYVGQTNPHIGIFIEANKWGVHDINRLRYKAYGAYTMLEIAYGFKLPKVTDKTLGEVMEEMKDKNFVDNLLEKLREENPALRSIVEMDAHSIRNPGKEIETALAVYRMIEKTVEEVR